MSQPTAILPFSLWTSRRSCSAAQQHDGARHRQRQAEDQARGRIPAEPESEAEAEQRRDADLHDRAGHRDRLHREQVLQEKCRPTPNISRMTPISASSLARFWSATKPGVNGPTATPASR